MAGTSRLLLRSPILSVGVLEALAAALESLAAGDPAPVVLGSDHPTIFLAGADLREIAALDAQSCVEYAKHGRRLVRLLETFPSATVAAVDGSCSGGGFDIALACDLIAAGPGASFAHPGVRRGLVTGWSGSVTIPPAVGPGPANAVFIEARKISGAAAEAYGFARRTGPDTLTEATEIAGKLARLDPERRRLWRELRGRRFVDRFRASVVHKL